ncbi:MULTISPECIES: restriction endonuclease subunit S [Methylobacter]
MYIPEGWNILQISEILERVSDPIFPELKENYYQIGIRSHGKGLFYKEPVTGEALGNKRVFRVHPDCFIVNIVFAWEQAVTKTSANEIGMIASHRFPMFRPKNNLCDVDYLTYFFKSPKGKYLLGLASPGGAGRNKTLGQSELSLLRIMLPPTKEQQKIAHIFSIWDKALEKLEALIAAKQKLKKAMMQQLLTGKVRFPGFEREWKNFYLENIVHILVSPVDKKTIENEQPVLLCNYTDVYYNIRITKSLAFMRATATEQEISKFSLKKGDVIITKDSETPGDIAIPAFVSDDLGGVVCGYHLAILRPKKDKIDGEFLSYLFSLPKTRYYFYTLATGATRFGLSIRAIEKAIFHLPPIDEQQKIAAVLSAADKEITTNQKQLATLKQQKKGLMQQLLTGKKRVNVGKVV